MGGPVEQPQGTIDHVPAPEAAAPGGGPPGGSSYRILEPHAQGGLGQVSVAWDEKLRRRVALKEIRADRRSDPRLQQRFLTEAEITGQLEHPGVVPVYALGQDEAGQPYYAMRFIQGRTLAEAVAAHHARPSPLSFRALLKHFTDVCQTIAYAHSRGVIHRDLKPANVILGDYGETLVLDWGLAKRVGAEPPNEPAPEAAGAEGTRGGTGTAAPQAGNPQSTVDERSPGTPSDALTQAGDVVGTPSYMAPEQAEGRLDAISPRSDIYALGAVLYQVLTGRAPHSGGDGAAVLARLRQGPPPAPRQLRRDVPLALEAVCLKAMARAPADRYAGAADVAGDVQAWLADLPVSAHREPWSARAGRWLRRHRTVAAAAAALLITALVATSVGAALLADANAQTRKRLNQVEQSNEVLTSVFTDLDIRRVKTGTEPLEAVLARRLVKAAGELEGESVGDPLAVAGLQDRLGLSLLNLGYPQEAIPPLTRAVETRKARLGADHPDTLEAMNNLAEAYREDGKLDLALPLYQDTLRLRRARLGADHPDTLVSMNNLALGYQAAGKLDLALPLYEETLNLTRARLGADHPDTLNSMNNLAEAYRAAGRLDRALPLFEETLKLRKKVLGADHPDTLQSMNNLAVAYRAAEKLDRALPLFEECLKLAKARLGADHPLTLTNMNNLAAGYQDAGRLDLSLPLYEETLKLQTVKLGADHPDTLATANNLAVAYQAAGKLDLALPLFEETLRLRRAKLGADHPDTVASTINLAVGDRAAGKLEQALPLLEELAAGLERRHFQHEAAGRIVNGLTGCYQQLGRFDRAEEWRRKWMAVVKERAGADSLAYAEQQAALALVLLPQRKWADAEAALRVCLAVREQKQPDAWTTFVSDSMLGAALLGRKEYAAAEPLLLKGYRGIAERADKIPTPFRQARLTEAVDRLVRLYEATGNEAEAARWRKESESVKKAPAKPPPP